MNRMTVSLSAAVLLALTAGAGWAQSEKPDATFNYSGGAVAAGIGYTWGHGVLHYKGKDYPFTANGLNVVSVGAVSVEASGTVYHLSKVADFPGNFTALTAGMTVAGGGAATTMKNQNGVVVDVRSTTQGVNLELAPGGIGVAFSGAPTPAS